MRFDEKVLGLVKSVPRGRVTTYKIIAEKLGTNAYRAVGSALKRNKRPIIIPCHRVIRSDLKIGNYSGSGGIKAKERLLLKEGVKIEKGRLASEKQVYLFK